MRGIGNWRDLDTQLREPSPETREWIESLRRAYLEKYGNDADARTVSFSEWLTRAEVALAERDAMCPTCGGSGQVIRMRPDALLMKMIHVGVPCPTCRG